MSAADASGASSVEGEPADPPAGAARTADRLPREVWVLASASFVIAIGYGLVAPALPAFATSFDVGVTASSMVISAFAFMRLGFAPVSGRLVAWLGERPVYLSGLLIVAGSTAACAFAQGYWQLLVFRALGGIGSTMFTVSAVSMLVRFAPPHLRGRASSLWATSFLLGNISGPLLGGLLVAVSLRLPFLVYGVALLVAAFVVWSLLRRSELAARDGGARSAVSVRDALRTTTYRASLLSNFANGWAVLGVRVALVPLFVTEVLHRSSSFAGVALSVFAVGNAAVLVPAGRLSDARGRKPLAIFGLAVAAAGTVWLGLSGSMWTFLLASAVAGVGAGLLNPAHNAAVADVVGKDGKGGPVLAGFQMASDIGSITGPLLAGVLADVVSYRASFAVTAIALVAALLVWTRAAETLARCDTAAVRE